MNLKFKLVILLYGLIWRLPFNWKTPLGYPIAFSYLFISGYPVFFHLIPVLSFGIGSIRLFISMIDDILNDLRLLNEMNQKVSTTKNCQQMKTLFTKIIIDFSDVKQLSWYQLNRAYEFSLILTFSLSRFVSEFNDIYEFNIINLFLWTVLIISNVLWTLQLELVKCELKSLFEANMREG